MIHVCSLAALPETVRLTGASHVLTVMANVEQVARPVSVLPANHLKVSMDDITEEIDGFVAPSEAHIDQVLNFVRGWDRGAGGEAVSGTIRRGVRVAGPGSARARAALVRDGGEAWLCPHDNGSL